MTHDYDGSQVLFRQAKARALAARRHTTEAEQQQDGAGRIERQQRVRDAVMTALILAQAAAEGYANWVHLQAGTKPGDSWIERWKRLTIAANAMNRPSDFALSDDQHAFLEELGAWRNYLLHADAKARRRLRELLTKKGLLADEVSEPDLLTADFAETAVRQADQLFRWAEERTGIQAPFLDAAWIAPDEC